MHLLRLTIIGICGLLTAWLLGGCQNSELGTVVQKAIAPALPTPVVVLPLGFPREIPQPPTGKLTTVQQEKFVTWRSSQSLAEITNFYQQQLQKPPWQLWHSHKGDHQTTIIAKSERWLLLVGIATTSAQQTEVTLTYSPLPPTPSPVPETDLLAKYVNDLKQLLSLDSTLDLSAPVLRREYVRWLVQVNNRLNPPSRQVRLANPKTDQGTFADVPPTDPDFPAIQGLANAGFLARTENFRPDQPLTREEMIHLKVPFDLGQFPPPASLAEVQNQWQFQDSEQISSYALRSIAADAKLGENSNIRRSFGFITLLQPQSHPRRREALASLWYFGTEKEGISVGQFLRAQNNAP